MERIPMNQTAMNSPLPELPELLASIRSHADLMKIPESELPRLAEEIRNTLIHSLSLTGGHLGPNLGVVELSIALHRVFETPRDKIIFDVSHQAYVHKMLTGRDPLIHTIRQHGGTAWCCLLRIRAGSVRSISWTSPIPGTSTAAIWHSCHPASPVI